MISALQRFGGGIVDRIGSVLAAAVPDLNTALLVGGVASLVGGVAMFDRRFGLILFGLLCFLGLYARVRWGAR